MATKKKATRKRAAKKAASPKSKAPRKKPASPEKPKADPALTVEEYLEARGQELPTENQVIFHLRGASRHWPHKIGKFFYSDEHKKWIYEGKPFTIEEWNEAGDALIDEARGFEELLAPGVKVVTVTLKPEDDPNWKAAIVKAHQVRKDPVEPVEEPPATDERTGSEEGSSEEALY